MKGRILYLRNFASEVNIETYNLQEVGLCKELVKKGYNCDIVYYSNENVMREEEIFNSNHCKLRVFWMPGIKVFNNSIFKDVLKSEFLEKYCLIISTEYNQIMSYLLARKKLENPKLALYHGPYKDNNKLIVRKIYDKLFLKKLIKKVDFVFSKSTFSRNYLKEKGFNNPIVLGVGIDKDKLLPTESKEMELEYNKLFKGKRTLLYVGKLEERKNITFLFQLFAELRNRHKDLHLILIGTGDKEEVSNYFLQANELSINEFITHIPKLNQNKISFFYERSEVFLFPSNYEIFGMVLLESLYFGIPVISSRNGGADLLIENNKNGFIIEEYDIGLWVEVVEGIIDNAPLREAISNSGRTTISETFNWRTIANKLLDIVESK